MKQQGFGGVRFESQRFRLLSIVVGCFLISVTFLLSTRPESTVFDTRELPSLSPALLAAPAIFFHCRLLWILELKKTMVRAVSPKMAWLEETRSTPVRSAVKTVKPSSSSLPRGLGRDFLVDVAPKQGDAHGRQPEQSAGEKTETEWVKDTVIIQESSAVAAERAEQEEAEQGHGADAGAGEDATPGATEEVVRDDVVRPTAAVITARPAVETTPTPATTTRHDQDQLLPMPEGETRKAGGRMMKLHAEPATTEQHQLPTPGRLETPEPERAARDQPQQPLPPLCDFSDRRSDVCDFTGDIRMDANASSFVVVVDAATAAQSHKSDVGAPISRVGAEINSADVLVGVHGAGLTNMMFLPPGATMVQVVPWGGLQWIARMDYGDPAEAMGLRYVQYEIGVEESSLKDTYPRGHKIFTDPTSLHKKGFGFMRHTLMDGQNITLDLGRFRGVLQQALGNYLAQ
ncbi:hypothetical protein TRIUR3_09976 [Triticum urartu]|uniref:Uncharacterized protein n=1 Tax=Triticum urartu TaxID=4572 RepID=M7YYF9_TRIUA|nr:hypothetical protein TRIUR3_09976 [Triticum urartu]